jgi:hypothetical protein
MLPLIASWDIPAPEGTPAPRREPAVQRQQIANMHSSA